MEGAFPFSELIPLDYLRRTVLAAAFATALADANGLTVLEVDEDLDLLFRFHVLSSSPDYFMGIFTPS
jgi:hypothetical protein